MTERNFIEGDMTEAIMAEAQRLRAENAASRQLCKTHPNVDYRHAWGCPQCKAELRGELFEAQSWRQKTKRRIVKLENERDTLNQQLGYYAQKSKDHQIEADRWRGMYDGMCAERNYSAGRADEAEAERDGARAEVARLRAAVERLAPENPDDGEGWCIVCGGNLRHVDGAYHESECIWQALRQALAAPEAKE